MTCGREVVRADGQTRRGAQPAVGRRDRRPRDGRAVLASPDEVAAPAIDGGAAGPALTVAQYLDTVKPLAHEGGRIVQQGMKAGITDLGSGELDGELAVDSATGWTRQMRQVGTDWAAVVPPEELADAHAAFLGALERYVGVGLVLEEAAAAVQALMRERGEPAVPWLPDPAAEQDS